MKKSIKIITLFSFLIITSCQEIDEVGKIKSKSNSIISRETKEKCDNDEDINDAEKRGISLNFNFNIIYGIRDKVLEKSPRGVRFVDENYENSKIPKDFTNFNIQTFYDIIDLMPYVYIAYDRMIDNIYNGVIIDSTLRDKLIVVLNGHKLLTNDVKYTNMINNLINDSYAVTNKNKNEVEVEVEAFMQIVK